MSQRTAEADAVYRRDLRAHRASVESEFREELMSEEARMHARLETRVGRRLAQIESMAEQVAYSQKDQFDGYLQYVNTCYMREVAKSQNGRTI